MDNQFQLKAIITKNGDNEEIWDGSVRNKIYNPSTMEWEASTGSSGPGTDTKVTNFPANPSTSTLQTSTIAKLDSLLTELQLKADLTETQPVSAKGFSNIAFSGQVSVSGTSSALLAANTNRKYVHFTNNSNISVYIQYGSQAALNQGIKLLPNALLTLSGFELYMGQINAISAGSTTLIDVLEGV